MKAKKTEMHSFRAGAERERSIHSPTGQLTDYPLEVNEFIMTLSENVHCFFVTYGAKLTILKGFDAETLTPSKHE